MGVYSAAARWSDGTTSVTAVVVPVFTPSRLPFAGDRWTSVPPSPLVAVVDQRVLPADQPANAQFAARIRTTLSGSAAFGQGGANRRLLDRHRPAYLR